MRAPFKKFLASGNVFIWGCAAGVSVSLLMVFGLLLLIMINGLGYFWTSDIVELTLKDKQHVMGNAQSYRRWHKGSLRVLFWW